MFNSEAFILVRKENIIILYDFYKAKSLLTLSYSKQTSVDWTIQP